MIRPIFAASLAIAGCYSNRDAIGTYVAHVYRDGDALSAEICDIRPSRYSAPDPTSCRLEPIGPTPAIAAPVSVADGIARIGRRARSCAAELHVTGVVRLAIEIDRDHRVPRIDSDLGGAALAACIARGVDQLRFDTTPQTITVPFALATAS